MKHALTILLVILSIKLSIWIIKKYLKNRNEWALREMGIMAARDEGIDIDGILESESIYKYATKNRDSKECWNDIAVVMDVISNIENGGSLRFLCWVWQYGSPEKLLSSFRRVLGDQIADVYSDLCASLPSEMYKIDTLDNFHLKISQYFSDSQIVKKCDELIFSADLMHDKRVRAYFKNCQLATG